MRIVYTVLALWATVAIAEPLFKDRHTTLTPRDPAECTSDDIEKMDVKSCVCPLRAEGCKDNPCRACGHDAPKDVKVCDTTCTQSQVTCQGCGLFFNSLCRCLQNRAGDCNTNRPIQAGGDDVWALLPGHDNLTTTNKLISGILDMSNQENRAFGDQGWFFAQKNYDPSEEALVLNSWRARTHEQVHIHRCAINETTRDVLSSEDTVKVGQLTQMKKDPDLWCITREGGDSATSFATSIGQFLEAKHQGVCDKLVGAGILRDNKMRTWACATTNSAGPLGKIAICKPSTTKMLWVPE
ncbi:hypothetical protein CDV31_010372 [Fusarium ambrosium]|uniref:Uncharacterized protein n=1 Tax=Fusarium ambrosium TaxID=131363 RepID=A0A428TNX5_9HYPO|nr:hypothetical protein CDV31_010372 [Fusarium ambrosium]